MQNGNISGTLVPKVFKNFKITTAEHKTKSRDPSKQGALFGSTGHTPMKSAQAIEESLGAGFSHLLGMSYGTDIGRDIRNSFYLHKNSAREILLLTFHE